MAQLACVVGVVSSSCYLENYRDGQRLEIKPNSKIRDTLFTIVVPRNPHHLEKIDLTESENGPSYDQSTPEPKSPILKVKLCTFLSPDEIHPCKLSAFASLNILEVNTCLAISKWRLNHDYQLPNFLVEGLEKSSEAAQGVEVKFRLQESGFFELMQSKFKANWKNRN